MDTIAYTSHCNLSFKTVLLRFNIKDNNYKCGNTNFNLRSRRTLVQTADEFRPRDVHDTHYGIVLVFDREYYVALKYSINDSASWDMVTVVISNHGTNPNVDINRYADISSSSSSICPLPLGPNVTLVLKNLPAGKSLIQAINGKQTEKISWFLLQALLIVPDTKSQYAHRCAWFVRPCYKICRCSIPETTTHACHTRWYATHGGVSMLIHRIVRRKLLSY